MLEQILNQYLEKLKEFNPKKLFWNTIIIDELYFRFYITPDSNNEDILEIHIGTEEDREVGLYSLKVGTVIAKEFKAGKDYSELEVEEGILLNNVIKILICK